MFLVIPPVLLGKGAVEQNHVSGDGPGCRAGLGREGLKEKKT
jgi:hypothetical protein